MVLPTFRVGLPTLNNLIKNLPHRSDGSFKWISDAVKLSAKISHHTASYETSGYLRTEEMTRLSEQGSYI